MSTTINEKQLLQKATEELQVQLQKIIAAGLDKTQFAELLSQVRDSIDFE